MHCCTYFTGLTLWPWEIEIYVQAVNLRFIPLGFGLLNKTTQTSLMPSQPWVPLVLRRSNTKYQALNSSDTYTSFATVVLSEALAPTATRH